MFLPTDLTSSEADLAATVARQLLAHRRPQSASEERAARQEAAQLAAEMIRAQRAETAPDPVGESLPATGYHDILQGLIDREQAILDSETAEGSQAP